MAHYYSIQVKLDEMLEDLDKTISASRWELVARYVGQFESQLTDIMRKIARRPDLETEYRQELLDRVDDLELNILAIDTSDPIISRKEDRLIKTAIADYIVDTITHVNSRRTISRDNKLLKLANQVRQYIRYNREQIKNMTEDVLMSILNKWYIEWQDEVDNIDEVYNRVSSFIRTQHHLINSMMVGENQDYWIATQMELYNDKLFDVIQGPNLDVHTRSIDNLEDELLNLLIDLRWRSAPRNIPRSITGDLESLRDESLDLDDKLQASGIELEDIVLNYNSISINDKMQTDLDAILNLA